MLRIDNRLETRYTSGMTTRLSIPGFEDLEPLGQGGTATVWKARQTRLQRTVAIKILRRNLRANSDDLARFLREARAAASIIHPNLVQVIDAGEHEGMVYTVMEYVPGSSVADLLAVRKTFDERDALAIVSDLAAALDSCWRHQRMIHSDIKPDNILIHSNGAVKLADMGLACLGSMEDMPLEEGMTLGTPNFMPPEQAVGGRATDCRSDIYSLGATLYQMVTGVVPFGDRSAEEAMRGQVSGQLEDPWVLNPAISPGCALLIEKWMARKIDDRPADWTEVLADLAEVKAGRPPTPPHPVAGQSTVRRARTRPLPPGLSRQMKAAASALPSPSAVRNKEELHTSLMQAAGVALVLLAAYGYSGAVTFPNALSTAGLMPVDTTFELILPPEAPTPRPSPVAALAAQARPASPPVQSTANNRTPSPAAAPEPASPKAPDRARPWTDPELSQTLARLRAIQDSYQKHVTGQATTDLNALDRQLDEALNSLQAIRRRAPEGARIGERIRAANQLRFSLHQARKL
jgi:serine/threonine protein kinase